MHETQPTKFVVAMLPWQAAPTSEQRGKSLLLIRGQHGRNFLRVYHCLRPIMLPRHGNQQLSGAYDRRASPYGRAVEPDRLE
jgi:hypothetical protein